MTNHAHPEGQPPSLTPASSAGHLQPADQQESVDQLGSERGSKSEGRTRRRGFFQRFLDGVEFAGNKLPHPVTLFAGLAVLVAVLSWALSQAGLSVEDPVEGGQVEVFNLLSSEGIEWIFTSMVDNFLGFAPLGVVLATMIGIGMAEQTGLIGTALRTFILSIPRTLVTFAIVFAGIMSSVAADAGYVVLPPLAAILFVALGRHPLAGIAAAFAGVSAGFSANLLLSGTDVLLGELTIEAAGTVDPEYAEGMNLAMNYWFIIASTVVLAIVGTLISRFVVEPRLGPWKGEGVVESEDRSTLTITSVEKKGLIAAALALLVTVAALLVLIVPEGAPLRGEDGGIVQSPFMSSLVVVIIAAFFVPGLVYGIVTKVVRNDTDAVNHVSKTLAGMGMFLMLAFTAGQFIAYFDQSNLGRVVSVVGADTLESINLTGFPLVLAFMLFVSVVNIFVGSASAKWALLAPIMVPIMMYLGISPEFTQAAYRVADSATNILSPLLPYFAIVIVVAQRYDKRLGIGSLISVMLPYSLAFMAVWSLMTLGWMGLDLPLGPNAPVYYNP